MKLYKATTAEHFEKILNLYEQSFPPEEKKPFWLMLFFKDSRFDFYYLAKDKNEFAGLAIFAKSPLNDLILLNFFAVVESFRGQNIGSKALAEILDIYKDNNLILEIENTEIENSPNISERIRRKNFYLKNNLKILPFKSNLFGVEMEILGNDNAKNNLVSFKEYKNLYLNIFEGYRQKYIDDNITLLKN